jgi:hypothetical protein
MRTIFSILSGVFLAITAATSAYADEAKGDQEDFTIRPGIGFGSVKLGMDKKQIQETLGNHDGTYTVPGDIHVEYSEWKEPRRVATVRVFYDKSGKAIQLAAQVSGPGADTNKDKLTTADGIHLGSGAKEVFNKYTHLQLFKYRAMDSRIDYYDDTKDGIAFEFLRADTESEAKNRLYGILVHVPGRPVIADADELPVVVHRGKNPGPRKN